MAGAGFPTSFKTLTVGTLTVSAAATFASTVSVTGALSLGAGTAAAVAVNFNAGAAGAAGTGIYGIGATSFGLATSGVLRLTVADAAVTSTVPVIFPNGAVATPAVQIGTDWGFYNDGSGGLVLERSGTTKNFYFYTTGPQFLLASGGQVGWSSTTAADGTPDLLLYRDAANVLAQRNGTNAQILRVYNTYDGAGIQEWLNIDWQSTAGVALIYTNKTGGGAASRLIRLAYSSSVNSAIDIPTGTTGTITLASGSSTTVAFSAGRASITPTMNATSGTHYDFLFNHSFNPSGASTMVASMLGLTPTINYAGGGTGKVQILRIAPTNTALPTGRSSAIALSSTASALGGIHAYNTADEDTNTEWAVSAWVSDVYTIQANAVGTGVGRGMLIGGGTVVGTDVAGGNLTLSSQAGTSAGAASSIVFQTPTVAGTGAVAQTMATRLTVATAGLTMAEAYDLVTGTTTGTKIGTGTTQKIGFWNTAPVVQLAAVADVSAGAVPQTAAGATDCMDKINLILARLRLVGLLTT